jgi:hypothetical protein
MRGGAQPSSPFLRWAPAYGKSPAFVPALPNETLQ